MYFLQPIYHPVIPDYMKQALLLVVFFLSFSAIGFSQASNQRLALNTPSKKIEIKVFPNPVTNHFSIKNNKEVKEIIVFNMIGRALKRYNYVSGQKYFVGDLPKGMYLIQFLGPKNKIITTQRVSKR